MSVVVFLFLHIVLKCYDVQGATVSPAVGSTTMRDWCHSGPCHNGATCSNTDSGFQCQCAPGFTGEQCDQGHAPINPASAAAGSTTVRDWCHSDPCHNGATCSNEDSGFHCQCAPGFQGEQCDQGHPPTTPATTAVESTTMRDWCHSSPCHNGATCTNTDSGFQCQCAPGFRGEQCMSGHALTTTKTTSTTTTLRPSPKTTSPTTWKTSTAFKRTVAATSKLPPSPKTTSPTNRKTSSGITKGTQASQTVRQTTTSNQPSPGNPTADTNNLGGSSAVNGTRYVVVEKEVGCSVILCYIIIPLLSILCFVILAAFIAICFYYRMERQKSHELARVNPETPKVRRAFVAHR